ncbi:MAG TPA: hypothetical protein PLY21_12380 [Spirochaetota bacterium]|nr:hypothetical protein [Spirochaetota bacterium]
MIVHECDTAVIMHKKDKNYLYIKWQSYTLASDYHKIADTKFNYMIKHKIKLLLSDITEQKVVAPAEQEYARDRVIHFHDSMGDYRHAIIINPRSIAAACAFSYKTMVNDTLNKEIIRMFESEKEALEWLLDGSAAGQFS